MADDKIMKAIQAEAKRQTRNKVGKNLKMFQQQHVRISSLNAEELVAKLFFLSLSESNVVTASGHLMCPLMPRAWT